MPKKPLTERQEALLQHLDPIYLMAQAVTPDTDEAVQIVEATYTQAFATPPLRTSEHNDKRWLLHLLMQIRHEKVAYDQHTLDDAPLSDPPPEALHALRQDLAARVIDEAMPTLLAALTDEDRLLLMLCEVQSFSCEDAGYILRIDPNDACQRLYLAQTTVREALHSDASENERKLFGNLPEDWLATALYRAVETTFGPTPPTLRSTVLATTKAMLAPVPSPSASDVPSAHRSASAQPKRSPRLRSGRLAAIVIIILTIGGIGYLASDVLQREPETNLITLSVDQSDAISPAFRTGSPEQAEEFVRGRLDWRLTLPTIDQAVLTGVGIRDVVPGVTVPVFLYEDTNDGPSQPITLYVFSYSLLDAHGDHLVLEPEIQRQIQDNQRFDLHDLGKRNVLVWRNRDDIFVAVTPGNPEALRERIVFPS